MPDFIFRPAALLGLALAAASLGSGARADAAETAPLILPPPDLAKLQLEDGKRSGGPYRYGIQVPSEMPALGPGSDAGGTWSSAKHGRLRWSRRIASPGARSLDFHFSRLQLPTGAELHIVGDGEGNARVIRAEQLDGNQDYHSPYVRGDVARLEIVVPAALRDRVEMQLAHVTHGYRGLFDQDPLQKSGSCNVDVACPAGVGWDDQIDAVGQYTFSADGSSYVCTGTLVGNTANTSTPYFLTANHCMSTQLVASTVVVYWNYQSATCRAPNSGASGTPLSKTIATHNQSGSTLVATHAATDFTLLRLTNDVPAGADAFFSGWDATGTTPTSAAGVHHPLGHEKRISIDNEPLQISGYGGGAGSTHWRIVDWNEGTTEGGSSGSGLWNQDKRLVGQLHGGAALCGNDLSDYYGRLSLSWTGGGAPTSRLSDHLNPGGGITSFAGYRTAGGGGNVAPVANYTFVIAGLGVTFTDASADADGSIASRSWDFGDGTTSTATNPIKTYGAGGTYTVALTVTDNGGLTHSTSKSVTVAAFGQIVFRSGFEAPPQMPLTYLNATDYPIADNSTVDSPVTVAARIGNAPAATSVSVDIVHTYQGDLKVDLVAPDGTLYNIHDRTGAGTDNLVKTVVLDLSSEPLNGVWNLRVFDGAGGDTGYINSWNITF